VIVIDTTVLIYAVGDEHPLRAPCRDLVAALREGRLRATTTTEVIQEFAHVRARRRSRSDAAALARDYARLLAPLLVVDTDDLLEGLSRFEDNDTVGAFDAVLAAAAMRRGAELLVSADSGFAELPGLRHVDPATPGLIELLSS
jgi:predicted nucleic acid-binding protein